MKAGKTHMEWGFWNMTKPKPPKISLACLQNKTLTVCLSPFSVLQLCFWQYKLTLPLNHKRKNNLANPRSVVQPQVLISFSQQTGKHEKNKVFISLYSSSKQIYTEDRIQKQNLNGTNCTNTHWLQRLYSTFTSVEVEDIMWPTDTPQMSSGEQNARDVTEMAVQKLVRVQTVVVSFK